MSTFCNVREYDAIRVWSICIYLHHFLVDLLCPVSAGDCPDVAKRRSLSPIGVFIHCSITASPVSDHGDPHPHYLGSI